MPIPILLIAVSFILSCMLLDLRTRRIPNELSLAALTAGVVAHCVQSGAWGVAVSGMGALLAGGLLLVPFALGGIGGGDVKMMAAVGSLLGPLPALAALIVGTVLGGAIMAVHLASLRRLREKSAATLAMLLAAGRTRSFAPLEVSAHAAEAVTLPYSVPLGLGALAVIFVSVVVGPS